MSDLYRFCPECEGSGRSGQDICDLCVASESDVWGMVPVTIDYGYILDWAIDVGGLNYRPDMQEIKDVLNTVTGGDDE